MTSESKKLAESNKEEGNAHFKKNEYQKAIVCYTKAINLQPNVAAYYGNRCACYFKLNCFKEALEDAKKSIIVDPKFTNGYVRSIKCQIAIGDFAPAKLHIDYLNKTGQADLVSFDAKTIREIELLQKQVDALYEQRKYNDVVNYVEKIIDKGCYASHLIARKAESLVYLKRLPEANVLADQILNYDVRNSNGNFIKGLCLYYENNLNEAIVYFTKALKYAPDDTLVQIFCKKAKKLMQKKDDGKAAFRSGRYQEALNCYNEALLIDPENWAKLYVNKAVVLSKMEKWKESINSCTEALKIEEKYIKAILCRAKCHLELGEYEKADKDYEAACKLDGSLDVKKLFEEGKLAKLFKLKNNGNEAYKSGKYQDALNYYNDALLLCNKNSIQSGNSLIMAQLYFNRATAFSKLGKLRDCVTDCTEALKLDGNYVKALMRRAKTHMELCEYKQAAKDYLEAFTKDKSSGEKELLQEASLATTLLLKNMGNKAYELGDYQEALDCYSQGIFLQNKNPIQSGNSLIMAQLYFNRATVFSKLGKLKDCVSDCTEALKLDGNYVKALIRRAKSHMELGEYKQAAEDYLVASTKDNGGAKHELLQESVLGATLLIKNVGNEAYESGRYQEALDFYSQAISLQNECATNNANSLVKAQLYFNRATAFSKLGQLKECIDDCSKAIQLDENYIKAILRRAKCHMLLGEYVEAVKDYEIACNIDECAENRKLLEDAEYQVKRSDGGWKDFYKILNISKTASEKEIKKAYKKQALIHHPDKHQKASKVERIQHEKSFKDIAKAYEILSDQSKRVVYDREYNMRHMNN